MENKKLSALLLLATVVVLGMQAQGKEVSVRESSRVCAASKTTPKKHPKAPKKDKDFVVPDFSLFDDKKKKDQKEPDGFDAGKRSKKFYDMKGKKEFGRPQVIGKTRPRVFNISKELVRS